MAVMTVMPRAGDWTVDDLDRLPDDGFRYELVDGVLLVSPAPGYRHQTAVGELFHLLRSAEVPPFQTMVAPFDFRPTNRRSFQPDLLVVRVDEVTERGIVTPPALAVEVLSPGTRSVDLLLKRGVYQECGVPSYWLVDPVEPSVTVLELHGAGRYREVAVALGDEPLRLEHPFRVELVPAALVARIGRDGPDPPDRPDPPGQPVAGWHPARATMTGTGVDPAITGEPPEEPGPATGACPQ
jgi:Uma2 family endonuclease